MLIPGKLYRFHQDYDFALPPIETKIGEIISTLNDCDVFLFLELEEDYEDKITEYASYRVKILTSSGKIGFVLLFKQEIDVLEYLSH